MAHAISCYGTLGIQQVLWVLSPWLCFQHYHRRQHSDKDFIQSKSLGIIYFPSIRLRLGSNTETAFRLRLPNCTGWSSDQRSTEQQGFLSKIETRIGIWRVRSSSYRDHRPNQLAHQIVTLSPFSSACSSFLLPHVTRSKYKIRSTQRSAILPYTSDLSP